MGYAVEGGRVKVTLFRPPHVTETQPYSSFEYPVGRNLFLNDTLHGEILAVCTVNIVRGREAERGGRGGRERETVSRDYDFFFFLFKLSDYLFKLLLIGDSGVGKSCLLLRFAVSLPTLQ